MNPERSRSHFPSTILAIGYDEIQGSFGWDFLALVYWCKKEHDHGLFKKYLFEGRGFSILC